MKRKRRNIGIVFFFLIVICVLAIINKEKAICNLEVLALNPGGIMQEWQITDEEIWPNFLPAQDRLGAEHAFMMAMEKGNKGASHTVYQYAFSAGKVLVAEDSCTNL